jgi:hypothetical protein
MLVNSIWIGIPTDDATMPIQYINKEKITASLETSPMSFIALVENSLVSRNMNNTITLMVGTAYSSNSGVKVTD